MLGYRRVYHARRKAAALGLWPILWIETPERVKSRGCVIEDNRYAEEFFHRINYVDVG